VTEPEADAFTIRRPGQMQSAPHGPTRHWYGLPILITDGVAYILLATAVTDEKSRPFTVTLSLPAYALGGPITHAANGNWGRSGLSLLLRAGLPFAGLLVGSGGCGRGSGDCAESLATMAIVGMGVASMIDVAALSWKSVEPPRAASLQPSLVVSRDVTWIGASGRF